MITVEWRAEAAQAAGMPVHPTRFVAWKGRYAVVSLEHHDHADVAVVVDESGIHVTDLRDGATRHVAPDEYDRIEWQA